MLAEAAFLLSLVTEKLRNRKPLNGFFVIPLVGRDHAGHGWSHLRPERNGSASFVLEIVELSDNFVPALGGKKFERFKGGAVVFPKAIPAGYGAPPVKNELACIRAPTVRGGEGLGIKITKAG
jgi:hypothetical protein